MTQRALASILACVFFCFLSAAGVVDRVAVVVGNHVITESQVQDELRLSEFLNGEPLDLGPARRRAAAEQLVDQQLIGNEMRIGGYQLPPESDADAMLQKLRQKHYPNDAAFHAVLAKYGITEAELRQYFHWQLAVMRFTDLRFRAGIPATPSQDADRMGATTSNSDASAVDEQLDAWLKEARAATRIEFKPEAFQ